MKLAARLAILTSTAMLVVQTPATGANTCDVNVTRRVETCPAGVLLTTWVDIENNCKCQVLVYLTTAQTANYPLYVPASKKIQWDIRGCVVKEIEFTTAIKQLSCGNAKIVILSKPDPATAVRFPEKPAPTPVSIPKHCPKFDELSPNDAGFNETLKVLGLFKDCPEPPKLVPPGSNLQPSIDEAEAAAQTANVKAKRNIDELTRNAKGAQRTIAKRRAVAEQRAEEARRAQFRAPKSNPAPVGRSCRLHAWYQNCSGNRAYCCQTIHYDDPGCTCD